MISANVEVEVTGDGKEGELQEIKEALRRLVEEDLLVGITDDTAGRSGAVSNAELAYIHTNGVRSETMKKETDDAVQSGTPYPLALQAYIKEHGSPAYRVPPRPFLEPAIEKHLDQVEMGMKAALLDVLNGGTGQAQRERLGAAMAAQVQNYFQEDNGWPPNSPKTIKKKGSDQPLVNTGILRRSITYVIRGKKEG